MLRVLGLLWRSLGEYYYDIVSLTGINLLWLLTSAGPFFGFLALAQYTGMSWLAVFSLLALIIVPPSLGGLMYATQQFNLGESVDRHTYFTGLRRYFKLSWLVFITDVLIGGLLALNCWFYLSRDSTVLRLVGLIWIYALAFWLMVQCYLWPLMVEQERKKLTLMYRNSALLIIDNLGFSIALIVVLIPFIFLCLILGLPALLFMGVVAGLVVHKALTRILEKYQTSEEQPGPVAAEG